MEFENENIMASELNVTVFSWNVLADTFFSPANYPTYEGVIFNSVEKKQQVLRRIYAQMKAQTLIALQEVCDILMPDLVKLAVNNGYTIRDAYYGGEEKGNMGVVLMWPTDLYKVEKYDQIVVGQYIEGEAEEVHHSWLDWWREVPPPQCPLEYAQKRPNILIGVNLIGPEGPFTLAVYHMPCAFWDERIMKYHLQTVCEACRSLNQPDSSVYVKSNSFYKKSNTPHPPLIICMDMNAKPDSPLYASMLEADMVSAHAFEGEEPEFTTWAQSKREAEPFKATIDYIWVSKDSISKVTTKMAKCKAGMMPSNKYPSDHLWTTAQLKFGPRVETKVSFSGFDDMIKL
jgi:hypothetical protein